MFLEPSPIDVHLANRLRLIRTQCDVTQHELGELIGVTYQQIQKYESALNKISASRLYEICRVLNRPISNFFEDVPIDKDYYNFTYVSEDKVELEYKKKNKKMINLIKAFNKIEDEELKLSVTNLVGRIAKIK